MIRLLFISSLLLSMMSHAQTISYSQRFINFRGVPPNQNSTTYKVNYQKNANGYFKVGAPYLISSDSVIFKDSIYSTLSTGVLYLKCIYPAGWKDTICKQYLNMVFSGNDTASSKIFLLSYNLSDDSVYSIGSWNVKWFGDADNCGCDPVYQANSVGDFLNKLNPDMMALQEIVDTARLSVLRNLSGNQFNTVVSGFGSFADSTNDPNYKSTQKLVYFYRDNLFKLNHAYPFTKYYNQSIANTYYYFSSGRYPYKASFTNTLSKKNLHIVNLHAKAGTTNSDYSRRLSGAVAIRDSVNTFFVDTPIVVIGDYNDQLEGSITTNPTSPYIYLLNNNMKGISLPSKYPNQKTYAASYGTIIDNVCANNSMMKDYTGLFTILSEIEEVYDSYKYDVSDHYPIITLWKKEYAKTASIEEEEFNITYILTPEQFSIADAEVNVYNILGQKLQQISGDVSLSKDSYNDVFLLLEIFKDGKRHTVKW